MYTLRYTFPPARGGDEQCVAIYLTVGAAVVPTPDAPPTDIAFFFGEIYLPLRRKRIPTIHQIIWVGVDLVGSELRDSQFFRGTRA